VLVATQGLVTMRPSGATRRGRPRDRKVAGPLPVRAYLARITLRVTTLLPVVSLMK